MTPKILFVLTSHDKLGELDKKTGWYLPECAHPYLYLEDKAKIVFASPKGGEAPLDPSSVEAFKDDAESQRFLKEREPLWKNTEKLSDFVGKADEFDAIFYVGGHGPVFDLAFDKTSQQLIREFYNADKVVSAVCHGPAVFLHVELDDGSSILADKTVTCFTNVEEDATGLTSAMPYLVETELKAKGATFENAAPWAEKVVVSGPHGRFITGQNPASAGPLAKAVLRAIKQVA